MQITYHPKRLTIAGKPEEIVRHLQALCREQARDTSLQIVLRSKLPDKRVVSWSTVDSGSQV